MLLPDNINPKYSLYFSSSLILKILMNENNIQFINLYEEVRKENSISFSTFILCLDWLYLIETAVVKENGEVELCI